MWDNLRERLIATVPSKEQMKPFLGSFGLALLGKVPATLVNTGGMLFFADKMKDNPDLIPIGLMVYGALSLGSTILDYAVLRRDQVAASAKANTIYRALTFAFPQSHEFNSATAQVGTVIMDLVGISPDPTALYSTLMSLVTGDPIIMLAQRLSNELIKFPPQVFFDSVLWLRGNKKNNGVNP